MQPSGWRIYPQRSGNFRRNREFCRLRFLRGQWLPDDPGIEPNLPIQWPEVLVESISPPLSVLLFRLRLRDSGHCPLAGRGRRLSRNLPRELKPRGLVGNADDFYPPLPWLGLPT